MSLFSELKRRNVLRVAIAYVAVSWLIIQVVETLFPVFELSPASIRLVAIALFIGFPLVLIFSWLYELTPEGLKLEKDVDRTASVVHHTGKKLDRAIIVVLTLSLGYFAVDKFLLDPSRDAEIVREAEQRGRSEALVESFGENSIAVLPFVNMSDNKSNEYFSDGISEELLNLLSQIPKLRVISRSSSFSFKGKDISIPAIAEQLNVAHVLEGSVRRDGDRVRITAQLIEARSDSHLWSETYDRKLDDIFAVQDEISAAIVVALKERLGLQLEAVPRVIGAIQSEAHDAFLRGRYLRAQRTIVGVEGAVSEFEKAIVLDPDYALAHAELAISALFLAHYDALTLNEAIAIAVPHAERAMVLDPTLAEAHAAKGLLSGRQDNPEEALVHLKRAIQINPNYSNAYNWMAAVLGEKLGRYDEGFAAFEMAVRLDPLSIGATYNYIGELILRERLVEADRELEKLDTFSPSFYAGLNGFRESLGGKWASLILGYLDAWRIKPEDLRWKSRLASPLILIGLKDEARSILDDPWPGVLSRLGNHGDAIAIAEARFAENTMSLAARSDLGMALANAGEYVRARPILDDLWQRVGGRVTRFGLFDSNAAAALIVIRQNSGDEDGIGELVAAMRDNVRRYHEAGITLTDHFFSVDFDDGLAAYLVGERERGLALIAKAVEDGYFVDPTHAYLQTLFDDPGFVPIHARQKARQVREREKFLAIVCTDNPYAAVWQPADETCGRFVNESSRTL